MGSNEETSAMADGDALDFARGMISFDSAELVSSRAWARTYRLAQGDDAHYLKIVPRHKAAVLAPVAALSRHFHHQTPRVVAFDAQRGWLLCAAHRGVAMDGDSAEQDVQRLVKTYAGLQADAATLSALFSGLPRPDIAALPRLLLAFLQPRTSAYGNKEADVGADYFVGHDTAVIYHRSLALRMALLERHLAPASVLPQTVNHGDLRLPNAGMRPDGTCVILDWDDAMAGPAGMSLHGLFGGCTLPTILLSGSAAAEAAAGTPNGVLIRTYVETLAGAGYCDATTLKHALPAAMCAGMIQFILNFAGFPGEDGRLAVADTLTERLSDLLNLCDLLTSREPDTVLEFAQDYEDRAQYRRAEQLLTDYSLRHPQDAAVLARLAAVQCKRGNLVEAAQTYRSAVELMPRAAALHAGLGAVLMQRLELADSAQVLRRAIELDPGLNAVREDLARVQAMYEMQKHARQPGCMPTLGFTHGDLAAGLIRPEMLALGASFLDTYGTLQIDNAFPVKTIERLHDAFMARYSSYFREADHPDALYLGDKRYMLTVDLEHPFSDPGLLGAPLVLPIIRNLLGDDCVLGAYTAVISLPGSKDQRLHKDHPPLFPNTPWHHTLPPFAMQIIIPLVPLNKFTGTTRFYKGSHRVATEEASALGAQDPVVPLGSCLLNDYRCAHRGLGNQSKEVRPILTLIFNRRWFRDFKNYGQQPPLRLTDAGYQQLPENLKPLFSCWREERTHDALDRSILRATP